MIRNSVRALFVALCTFVFSSCGGGGDAGGGNPQPPPATYSIRANVSGLFGTGLELSLNGGQSIGVSGNGTAALGSGFQNGQAYAVTVVTQPANPAQTCTLTNGTATVNAGNVEVAVACEVTAATDISAAVNVDSGAPTAAVNRIVEIVSGRGTTTIGGQVTIPWNAGGEIGPVLALDANGEMVMAAIGDSRTINLSAATTAVFLTRMMIGSSGDHVGSTTLDTTIRAAGKFPALESAVQSALAANQPLLGSTDVVMGINSVIAQLPASMRSTVAELASRASAITTPSVPVTADPFPIFTVTGSSWLSVAVSGAGPKGEVSVANGMPIAWKAGTSLDGRTFCAFGDSGCGYIDRSNLMGSLLKSYFGIENWFSEDIAGNGYAFDLTIGQNTKTRVANMRYVLTEGIGLAFKGLPGEKCHEEIIKSLLEALLKEFEDGNPQAFLDSVADVRNDFLVDLLKNLAFTCAFEDPDAVVKVTQGMLKTLVKRASFVITAYEVVDIGATFGLAVYYWNVEPKIYGVCVARNIILGADFGFKISNCAASYTFDPPEIFMAPGSVVTAPVPIPLDIEKKPTLSNAIPEYTFSTATPQLLSFDPVDRTISAADPNLLGTANLTVEDKATGAVGTLKANIVWPAIEPAFGTATAGATLTFRLTDGAGHQLGAVAPGTRWVIHDSGNPTTALTAIPQGDGTSATVTIPDPAPAGAFTISAECFDCQLSEYARVPIHSGEPYAKIAFETPPNWTGTPNYGLWGVAYFAGGPTRCINWTYEMTRRMWNQNGELTRDEEVSDTGIACTDPNALGSWRLRSDGRFWGLLLSGGIGNGGRMQFQGHWTFDIPGQTNPYREQTFNCNVTNDNWSCGPN